VKRFSGLLLADENESDQLGLKRAPHGLVLAITRHDDGSEPDYWTHVTPDMAYFDLLILANVSGFSPTDVVPVSEEKFPILLRGWPADGIGTVPPLPDSLDPDRGEV